MTRNKKMELKPQKVYTRLKNFQKRAVQITYENFNGAAEAQNSLLEVGIEQIRKRLASLIPSLEKRAKYVRAINILNDVLCPPDSILLNPLNENIEELRLWDLPKLQESRISRFGFWCHPETYGMLHDLSLELGLTITDTCYLAANLALLEWDGIPRGYKKRIEGIFKCIEERAMGDVEKLKKLISNALDLYRKSQIELILTLFQSENQPPASRAGAMEQWSSPPALSRSDNMDHDPIDLICDLLKSFDNDLFNKFELIVEELRELQGKLKGKAKEVSKDSLSRRDIAKMQREWLYRLQQLFPQRDILIQHNLCDVWHSWRDCTHVHEPVYTRSVLLNEVAFDLDSENWEDVRLEAYKVVTYFYTNKIPFLMSWSGGKSIHLSVFFSSISIPDALASKLEQYNVDVIRLVRRYLASYLLSQANVDLKKAGIDKTKIHFSTFKKGSMLRLEGAKRDSGSYKTCIEFIPKERPSYLPLKFPEKVEIWDISHLRQNILSYLEDEVREYIETDLPLPSDFKSPLTSVHCAKVLLQGRKRGERRPGAFNLVVLGKKCGLSLEEILTALRVYHSRCEPGIGWEEIEAKARDTFERDYRPSCYKIREVFGSEICNKEECAISKEYIKQLKAQSRTWSRTRVDNSVEELSDLGGSDGAEN